LIFKDHTSRISSGVVIKITKITIKIIITHMRGYVDDT